MEVAFLVVLTIGVLTLILAPIFIIRNNMTCKYRVDLIHRDMAAFDTLPSYDKMLWSIKPLKDKYWLKNYKKK